MSLDSLNQLRNMRWYDLPTHLMNRVLVKIAAHVEQHQYGLHERQQLDLYIPFHARADRALMLFVHGGSWQQGDKSDYAFLGHYFAELGFQVAIMNYRLAPKYGYPDFVADVIQAINWLHLPMQCHRFGYNAQATVLMGHSAGAFNVMAALYHDHGLVDTKLNNLDYIQAVIGIAGPYSFEHREDPIAKHALPQQLAPDAIMPDYFVFKNYIRHVLLTASRDHLVADSNTMRMARALEQVGNSVRVAKIKRTNHVTIIGTLSHRFAGLFQTQSIVLDCMERALKAD